MTPVLEIGRQIDPLLSAADRRILVELLATLKHREVLILEALRDGAALVATSKVSGVSNDVVARCFRVSTRTVYRLARKAPLEGFAMWDGRRLRGYPCRQMSRADRGGGRLYLPRFRTKSGGPPRYSLVWSEIPDGHGGRLRGSTNVRCGRPGHPPREAREILYAKRAELLRGALLPGVLTWERVSAAYLQECEALGLESVRMYRARAAHLDRFLRGYEGA